MASTVLEIDRLQTFQKLTAGGAVSSRLKDAVANDEDGASREFRKRTQSDLTVEGNIPPSANMKPSRKVLP